MIHKSDILKCLSVAAIVLIRKADLLLTSNDCILPVAELFLQYVFGGNPSRTETDVVMVIFGLFEVIMFSILFGVYIYRDLYENSVYIFVRQRSRIKWFLSKAVGLFLYCAIYNMLFVGIIFYLCTNCSGEEIDMVAVEILVITYIMILLFTYWMTIIINILSFRFGATLSFMINYVALLVMSALAVSHEKMPIINKSQMLLKLNPVANVVIKWEDGIMRGIYPALYFWVLIVITLFIGCIIAKNMDIGLENREKTG